VAIKLGFSSRPDRAIGGFTVIYFGTLSLFIKPITEEFGWGRTELSALRHSR